MRNIGLFKKVNNIANICFLPQETNGSFNDAEPFDYLKGNDIDKPGLKTVLKSHLIPFSILKKHTNLKKKFLQFYEERKLLIIKMFEKKAGCKLFE
jgi:hypothetical protein